MQEQQLKARQLVLQQQAASAVAAASKTQREVRRPRLRRGVPVICGECMAAAHPGWRTDPPMLQGLPQCMRKRQ